MTEKELVQLCKLGESTTVLNRGQDNLRQSQSFLSLLL